MIVKSKAPLILGIAGGGTDVSPYSEIYGGAVLNATIDMYAYCTIESICQNNKVEFISQDFEKSLLLESLPFFELTGDLILHKAVYNTIVKEFNNGKSLSVRVTTYSDAPPGSGLGSSSTMVVAILSGYRELLNLPLGDYDIARIAYKIEREDCNMLGGKQDQYAATFGGVNFMEFYENDKVIVNPLRIKSEIINELESRMILFFSGVSRDSSIIIEDQIDNVRSLNSDKFLEAMHQVKNLSFRMKESLLIGDITSLINIFSESWIQKKQTSSCITNSYIESIEKTALESGASAVKVSGAGGGGFIIIFVDPYRKFEVLTALDIFDGYVRPFHFCQKGVESWKVE